MPAKSKCPERERDAFIEKLKRRHIVGSHETAKIVVRMLSDTAQQRKWSNAGELMSILKEFIQPLISAGTSESLVIGNVIRHVLWIIREEYTEAEKADLEEQRGGAAEQPSPERSMGERTRSLHSILTTAPADATVSGDFSKRLDVKGPIMNSLQEYVQEIDDIYYKIGEQASCPRTRVA